MPKDTTNLTTGQRDIYRAVTALVEESDKPLIPLPIVADRLGISQTELEEQLTPALLDTLLNYREDRPNSPGWLTLDGSANGATE